MAFAPYDNPEVVASCVIEQAGGSNDVGVTLRRMFNKYFNITE
jgi:cell division protein FtsI/penicillin-binding protein 2